MRERYAPQERAWVKRLISRLTSEQYERYVIACRKAPRHHNSGKLYDHQKAEIAEAILYAAHREGHGDE